MEKEKWPQHIISKEINHAIGNDRRRAHGRQHGNPHDDRRRDRGSPASGPHFQGAGALHKNPDLAKFTGRVSDSGEGRWTLHAAIDEGVPAPVISSALFSRFSSRGMNDFADKLLSAMRYEFGGHLEKTGGG